MEIRFPVAQGYAFTLKEELDPMTNFNDCYPCELGLGKQERTVSTRQNESVTTIAVSCNVVELQYEVPSSD